MQPPGSLTWRVLRSASIDALMNVADPHLRFTAALKRPLGVCDAQPWSFLVLPVEISELLPRRGRTTVDGWLNGCEFRATLEPDGQLSHWLKVSENLRAAAGVIVGDVVSVAIVPVADEPEPELPSDFRRALKVSPRAKEVWNATTTLARVDWIHWIESAKQAKTRASRIESACKQLASGKKRVCCFDPSGYFSKSLSAPKVDE
jgi:hypothetical protein